MLLWAAGAFAQQKPLVRDFSAGAASQYRVRLTVRTEVEGQQPVRIGDKHYVRPFSRAAACDLAWTATQRILSVGADGTAEVEETLEDFQGCSQSSRPADEETGKLLGGLRETLWRWTSARTLTYRETRTGQLAGLTSDGVPALDEELPRLLSLWLLRALRPTAALPAKPIHFGEPWQEPRAASLPNWAEVRGSETGEWLEAPDSAEPAVKLHLVQEISGTVVSGAERPPDGADAAAASSKAVGDVSGKAGGLVPSKAEGRFHGESVSILALSDARLLAATRSATREIIWTLAPVQGLREPPQFRGRLSVEVQIESCDETPCLSPGRPAVRQRQ